MDVIILSFCCLFFQVNFFPCYLFSLNPFPKWNNNRCHYVEKSTTSNCFLPEMNHFKKKCYCSMSKSIPYCENEWLKTVKCSGALDVLPLLEVWSCRTVWSWNITWLEAIFSVNTLSPNLVRGMPESADQIWERKRRFIVQHFQVVVMGPEGHSNYRLIRRRVGVGLF